MLTIFHNDMGLLFAVVVGCCVGFTLFAVVTAGKDADDAETEVYEHWRGER